MNIQETFNNASSLNACKAGLLWVRGKSLSDVWTTQDTNAAPFLLWWAIQMAGTSGWKSFDDVTQTIVTVCQIAITKMTFMAPIMTARISEFKNAVTKESAVQFYSEIESQILWDNPQSVLDAFRSEILPIIKELKPAI